MSIACARGLVVAITRGFAIFVELPWYDCARFGSRLWLAGEHSITTLSKEGTFAGVEQIITITTFYVAIITAENVVFSRTVCWRELHRVI